MSGRLKIMTLSLLVSVPLIASALERVALLPPEAQTYVRVSSTTNFWNRIQLSSLGRLWQDPQFQDFLGRPEPELWREVLFEDKSEIEGELLAQQLKMLQGELILAFDMETADPYIIAAMSEADFQRSLTMDEKLVDLTEQSFEIIKSTFQDIEIIQHIEKGGTADESSTWQAYAGTTFLMGPSRPWIEKCIVQLGKASVREPEGHPACDVNVPLGSLIRTLIEEERKDQEGAGETIDTELLFDALGLLGIDKFSLRIELMEKEMVADSTLQAADLDKGLFTILDLQPSELPRVDFIPENMASIEVGRFNLLRFWQEIPNVLMTAMPAIKPQFDMILALMQQQAGINLEQDLLAHMGTEYFSFSIAEDDMESSVIAIELKDGAAFRSGLETALAAPALQPQVTAGLTIDTFLDHTIYRINGSEGEEPIAFSVMESYLLYGDPDGIRQVLRSEGSGVIGTFERSPLVAGLRRHVPTRAFSFGAVDWKKYMTVIVREVTKPEYVTVLNENWAKSGSPIPPPDFNKLPPAEHIASFFNVSYQYAEETPQGIHQRIILKY